mmetsp:Transcript_54559/g.127036  ORF Transcript_54559/g.127036 Transcript_54559/m.127036 type:complete len:209 (+) Transcript_54559:506-1132(+)
MALLNLPPWLRPQLLPQRCCPSCDGTLCPHLPQAHTPPQAHLLSLAWCLETSSRCCQQMSTQLVYQRCQPVTAWEASPRVPAQQVQTRSLLPWLPRNKSLLQVPWPALPAPQAREQERASVHTAHLQPQDARAQKPQGRAVVLHPGNERRAPQRSAVVLIQDYHLPPPWLALFGSTPSVWLPRSPCPAAWKQRAESPHAGCGRASLHE